MVFDYQELPPYAHVWRLRPVSFSTAQYYRPLIFGTRCTHSYSAPSSATQSSSPELEDPLCDSDTRGVSPTEQDENRMRLIVSCEIGEARP